MSRVHYISLCRLSLSSQQLQVPCRLALLLKVFRLAVSELHAAAQALLTTLKITQNLQELSNANVTEGQSTGTSPNHQGC